MAGLGKLDRVADQVDQALSQPRRIGTDVARQREAPFDPPLQPFGLGGRPHQRFNSRKDFIQRAIEDFRGQLAGLDLGKVEDIVDD